MNVRKAIHQKDFFALMKLRTDVFVIEQQVDPSLEIDDLDQTCEHYIIEQDQQVVATCRILRYDDHYKIGRVAVMKTMRGKGIGEYLMRNVEAFIPYGSKIKLSAQIQALPFYVRLGYLPFGEHFFDAGIEHVWMEKIV